MAFKEGVLPLGVEFCGKTHKTFKMRPQLVGDVFDIPQEIEKLRADILDADKDTGKNDPLIKVKIQEYNSAYNLNILSKILIGIGDIPKENINIDLIKSMPEIDIQHIIMEKEEWEESLVIFFIDKDGKRKKKDSNKTS